MREKSSFSLTYEVSEDEIVVANILLELPSLIKAYAYESPFRFSMGWGSTRKRSASDGNRNHQSPPSRLPPALPSSSSIRGSSCAVVSTPEPEPDSALPKLKVEVSSPATPLSFSPSESDEKPKPSKRRFQVKKKEEWFAMIEKLTQNREWLKEELEKVNRYKKELEDFNLKLKARKQELSLGPKRETPGLNLQMDLGLASVKPLPTDEILPSGLDQSPFIMDHTALITEISDNIQYPANQIPFSSVELIDENMNPRAVPDLNLTANEFTGMVDLDTANKNLSKVMAAQARRNRIRIYRVKNSIAANKLRYR
ncbi:uncharacterized protein LOC107407789 isoform X2 [Ziziphus jujuba]|uniref:Uncharacterized protein LOC107407789 isoform X2 n=2 Tax=Ziziphus jujuba TaxID=326968 RepID=A0ABM3ILI1_ZIZJJ|nr:uncharacterized protein LOC107407789 isoform X2 [Ziziphus jujuba]